MARRATASPGRRAGLPPSVILGGYLLAVLVPLLLAATYAPRHQLLYRELAAGFALVGFVMLALQFVLSARFEAIAGRIGIDLLMRFHQLMARTALAFVAVHAALYVLPVLVPGRGSGRGRIVEAAATPEFYGGVVALALLVVLVLLALRRRRLPIAYELWRGLHGLLGVVILVLVLWHALALGRYAEHEAVAAALVGSTVIALALLAYVYLVKPLRLLRHPWRVTANRPLGQGLWEVQVEPEGAHRLTFTAGQFAWVNFRRWPLSLLDHPFSIASAPERGGHLAFIIQEAGDFTDTIGRVEPGQRVYLDAPHGAFTLAGRVADGIGLIAGGVGIAPILSVLRDLRASADRRPVRLLYGAASRERLVAIEELEEMRQELDFTARMVLAAPPADWPGGRGVLDAEAVQAWLQTEVGTDRPGSWLFLLCGPTPMMDSAERGLHQAGVPFGRILYERFAFD